MKCFYINLEAAASRRQSIENSFANFKTQEFSLERFPAVDIAFVTEHKIEGGLSGVEKACFLSHRSVLRKNLEQGDHVWILEDDQIFSPHTFDLVGNFLNIKAATLEWDIMYTDVGISTVGTMCDLFKLRRDLMARKALECLNLARLPFFGATSYIINGKSVRKISDLIGEAPLNIPYDLLLRKFIYEGKLNGHVTFPFLTTDSDEAINSSIQKSEFAQTDLLWSLFRKMTWLDGDNFNPTTVLNEIWSGLDMKSQLYGVLWAAMADPGFKAK